MLTNLSDNIALAFLLVANVAILTKVILEIRRDYLLKKSMRLQVEEIRNNNYRERYEELIKETVELIESIPDTYILKINRNLKKVGLRIAIKKTEDGVKYRSLELMKVDTDE